MQNIYYIVLFSLLNILICIGQNKYPKTFFNSPVDIKIAIAGTFGELRSNHFHSGIDIKTKQQKNIPIYAAQSGYVSRIKISSFGFGKALYINHDNNLTTVYAHLENFNEKIANKVLKEHYEQEKFEIDFHLKKGEIPIQKGDIIGFSGNTGSSTAPHLHFEIRDTKTQQIINPMLFGLPILDRTHPIISSILIYHDNRKESIKTKKINHNTYTLEKKVIVEGAFNISVNTFDLLDAAPNKCGVYSTQLYINDSLYYFNQMEKFSFSETKYINSHIDYQYYKKNNEKYQKCFVDLNNELSTYKKSIDQIDLTDGEHKAKIIIKDSYMNTSILAFNILFKEKKMNSISKHKIINSNQVFEYQNNDMAIYIPSKSLYKDYEFTYTKTTDTVSNYPVYKILDDSIPSHKSFVMTIQLDSLEKELRAKTFIAKIDNNQINCIHSKWVEDKIIGKSNSFGAFTIMIDSIKPEITDPQVTTNFIQVKISDQLSGIKEYRGTINKKWVLMEYDFKTNILRYNFDQDPLNKKQTINISVSDLAGNENSMNIDFYR